MQILRPVNHHVEHLTGFINEQTQDVLIVYLKVFEQNIWHRLFLDAGVGFWHVFSEKEIVQDAEEFEDELKADFVEKYNLRNCEILEANCQNQTHSHFKIQFHHGDFIFRYRNSEDIDSQTLVEFRETN